MAVKRGYKKTEIGVIPEDWKVAQIASVASVRTGPFGSTLHEKDYVDDGTPIITVEHLGEFGVVHHNLPMVSDQDKSRLDAYSLQVGDIVFSRVGSVDRNSLISQQEDGWLFSGRLLRIRVQGDRAYPPFLSYFFHSESFKQRVRNVAVGQTMPSLNTQIISNIEVILPPFLEQQAIAAALSDVDSLLASLDALIAKKRLIKQGVMQELLTGKRRLPGFTDNWQVLEFRDVADKSINYSIAGGPFGSNLKASDYSRYGVRIIQLQNIGDGVFHNDYAIYTSEKKADELISCNIYPGEIILSKMGEPVARACFVPELDNRYLMASDGIRLAVDAKRFDKRFVLFYINSPYFRKRAIEASTGSTRLRIGLSDLKSIPFIAPSLMEQQAIGGLLSDLNTEIIALERQREKMSIIKQGMMQELLTGRTRLACSI